MNGANGGFENVTLVHDALDPGTQRPVNDIIAQPIAHQDSRDLGPTLPDCLHYRERAVPAQTSFHEQNTRHAAPSQANHGLEVGRVRHDVHAGDGVDQQRDAFADHLVIVDYRDGNTRLSSGHGVRCCNIESVKRGGLGARNRPKRVTESDAGGTRLGAAREECSANLDSTDGVARIGCRPHEILQEGVFNMRGRRRAQTVAQTRIPGEPTGAREDVETAWYPRMTFEPNLGRIVTARGTHTEPFHRWLVFKQAFSPELVRRFLIDGSLGSGPVLDPFAGSGTTVVECARRGVRAIGVDPSAALSFVTQTKFAREMPDPPDLSSISQDAPWNAVAEHLTHPVHRAALICAVFRRHTSRGRVNAGAPPIVHAFSAMIEMMREDLQHPLPFANPVERGDGRELHLVADASIAAIITSPPYLSRHDYKKLHDPLDEVYRHWYAETAAQRPPEVRLPAHPRAHGRALAPSESAAVEEACDALEMVGQRRLTRVVRGYFEELFAAVREFSRVLLPGAPCQLVLGGARFKDVYIPSDTIVARFAESAGFSVDRFLVARRLIPGGRKFGHLTNVSPRESVLCMTRV